MAGLLFISQPRSRWSPGGLFPELRPRMHRVHRDRALAPPVAACRADRRRPQRYVETVLGSRHAAMERDHAPHTPEELALRARNETGRTQAPADRQSLGARPGAVSHPLSHPGPAPRPRMSRADAITGAAALAAISEPDPRLWLSARCGRCRCRARCGHPVR